MFACIIPHLEFELRSIWGWALDERMKKLCEAADGKSRWNIPHMPVSEPSACAEVVMSCIRAVVTSRLSSC